MNLDAYICTGTLYTLKVFKVLEPISTMFHGRFQYYFVEPYGSKFIDGIYVDQPEYEEIELDLSKLKVEMKEFKSPFTGKVQKYYFFNYDGEDIFIEDYDSTSKKFVERIVEKLYMFDSIGYQQMTIPSSEIFILKREKQ